MARTALDCVDDVGYDILSPGQLCHIKRQVDRGCRRFCHRRGLDWHQETFGAYHDGAARRAEHRSRSKH